MKSRFHHLLLVVAAAIFGSSMMAAQTFKGHHIGETASEFLSTEPVIQAKLQECQSTAPRELTADEIKKRFGKKGYQDYLRQVAANDAAYGGHPPSHIAIMDKDVDLYEESCGPAIDALFKGTGRIDGIGVERHNQYSQNVDKRLSQDLTSQASLNLRIEQSQIESHYDFKNRQFYFKDGLLASFSFNVEAIEATVDTIKADISSRLQTQPIETLLPMHNGFGATWNDVAFVWDTETLHVELTQRNNPAQPSLPRLSVESSALHAIYLERRKAAPSPLD